MVNANTQRKITPEQRKTFLRGEALGVAINLRGRAPNVKSHDLLSFADEVFHFLESGKVPEAPKPEQQMAELPQGSELRPWGGHHG